MKYHLPIITLLLTSTAVWAQSVPPFDPTLVEKITSDQQIIATDRTTLQTLRAQLLADQTAGDQTAIANDYTAIAAARTKLIADISTFRTDIKMIRVAARDYEKDLKAQLRFDEKNNRLAAIDDDKAALDTSKDLKNQLKSALKFEKESELEANEMLALHQEPETGMSGLPSNQINFGRLKSASVENHGFGGHDGRGNEGGGNGGGGRSSGKDD